MAIISTRPLSSDRPHDIMTISVDPVVIDPDSDGKTGYYSVVVNSITWVGTGLDPTKNFTLDVRAPQFNPQNDTALVDNATLVSDAGSVTPVRDSSVVAVVGTVPGPSAFIQGDGTWDLLHVETVLPGYTDITDFILSVDYNVSWHEISQDNIDLLSSSSVTLAVSDDQPASSAAISCSPESGDGVYLLLPNSLETLIDDEIAMGDSVPNFALVSVPTVGAWSSGEQILNHPISKASSHTKYYMNKSLMVYAVNDGKIDANGSAGELNNSGSIGQYHVLGSANLWRVPEWPSDDDVSASLSYQYGFISI
jgi:hypothetical protein